MGTRNSLILLSVLLATNLAQAKQTQNGTSLSCANNPQALVVKCKVTESTGLSLGDEVGLCQSEDGEFSIALSNSEQEDVFPAELIPVPSDVDLQFRAVVGKSYIQLSVVKSRGPFNSSLVIHNYDGNTTDWGSMSQLRCKSN
ncbi:MAG: hypothetical protein IT289_11060 [Oligoflexia bacterium]|nr:hypothetical protein [Oligoflexia bacterium]